MPSRISSFMKSLESSMRGAALLQLLSKYSAVAVQLIITAILARLVTPSDFGLLAIVTVFSAFFTMFSDMGLGTAIIQYQDLNEADFGALFFFSAILASVLMISFCLASLPISFFFNNQELIPLCCTTSAGLLFSTLNMVPNGLMLRERRFSSIGLRLFVVTLVSGFIAILFALIGWGVYALVLQTVCSSAFVFVWNIIARPVHNINHDFAPSLRKVFSYSAFQFGFGVINYFARNLDNLIIGRLFGSEQLGYYDKAYKLTTYPLTTFSSVISSIIQPFMAEHQDNSDYIFKRYLQIEKTISLIAAPITVVFFCASAEIIVLFYGENWGAAIPLFRILSLSVYCQMMNSTSGAFFQSLGRTDLLFKTGLLNTCISILGICLGLLVSNSLLGISIGISVAYFLHSITIIYLLLYKCFGSKLRALSIFAPDIFISILSAAIVLSLELFLPETVLLTLLIKLLLIFFVFYAGYNLLGQRRYIAVVFHRQNKG